MPCMALPNLPREVGHTNHPRGLHVLTLRFDQPRLDRFDRAITADYRSRANAVVWLMHQYVIRINEAKRLNRLRAVTMVGGETYTGQLPQVRLEVRPDDLKAFDEACALSGLTRHPALRLMIDWYCGLVLESET